MLSLMMQLEVAAQKQKTKVSLKDSLDGKFDMSSFLIDANGLFRAGILLVSTAPAKPCDEWKDFGSAKWIYSYGAGFRHLIARMA